MRRVGYFLVFIWGVLFGDHLPYEEVAFGGEPAGLIEGRVCAITGDYVVRKIDWVVQGHEPIVIERRHLSSKVKRGRWSGWEFFFNHLKAERHVIDETFDAADQEKTAYETYRVVIPEKYGFSLAYEGEFVKSNPVGSYKRKGDYPHALTNCYSGEIGARYSAFNNHVFTDENEKSVIKVHSSDGTTRAYQYLGCKEDFFLRWERLSNGNIVHYQWKKVGGEYRLWKVSTTGGEKTYAWMTLDYVLDGEELRRIEIETSDCQKLVYRIEKRKGEQKNTCLLLDRVEHSAKPTENFGYWGNKKTSYYVCDHFFPDNRRLRIDYYLKGDNPLTWENVKIKKHKDKKIMRVKRLQRPLLQDGGLLSVLEFYYKAGSYMSRGGYTDALDPYGNFTRYRFDQNFLLRAIEHYEKSKGLFAKEEFEWSDYCERRGHWIRGKTLRDGEGKGIRRIAYAYDLRGNVEREILEGELTGEGRGQERYEVFREYNGSNLVTKETFPNGKSLMYCYYPNTNLIHLKLTLDRGIVRIRNIYLYEGSVLKRQIIDDGSSQCPEDLTDVSERLIMDIHPKLEGSFLDFPEVIEEKYLDLSSEDEILLGRQVIEEYTCFGKPLKIAYFDKEEKKRFSIVFSYDEKGRLIGRTDPLGRKITFEYDANDNLILEDALDHPFVIENGYDISNRLIVKQEGERRTEYKYDFLSRKVGEVNFRGEETCFSYDPFGHVIEVKQPVVLDAEGVMKNPKLKRFYNVLGKIESEEDPEGNVTQTFYTCRGKPYRIIYPDGSEEQIRYNLEGEEIAHIKPGGTRAVYTRDFLNRVIAIEIFSKDGDLLSEEKKVYNAFHLIKSIAPDGVETCYEYDGGGKKICERTLDHVKTFHYDFLGRESKMIEGDARAIIKEYDLLNRIIEEREEDLEGQIYSSTEFTYDEFGNKIGAHKEVQVGKAVERTEYDFYKREIKKMDPLENALTTEYDDYFINALGQKVLQRITTNPNETKTIEEYDALDRLIKLEKFGPDDSFLLREEFYYDLCGKRVKQESSLDESGMKIVKGWNYDSRGWVIELIEALGDPLQRSTTYFYSSDGEKEKIVKPDGVLICYTYDGLGRQKLIQTSDGSCSYSLKYDLMGNIIQSYDAINGLITKRNYDHFGNLLHETLANGHTLERSYDQLDRKVEMTFLDGSMVRYIYDPYHLMDVQRIDQEGDLMYEHQYLDYDQSHNLLREEFIGGGITHEVDLCSRRVRSESAYSTEMISSIDPNGNVKRYERFAENKNEQSSFEYDFLDQLTLETGLFEHDFSYDSHHNRLNKDSSEYSTDALHQLVSTSESTYENDANGNRIMEGQGDQKICYSYDGLDRLVEIRSGDKWISFIYDSWNRCHTQKSDALKQIFYLYDDRNELGVYPSELRILGQGRGAEIGATVVIEKNDRFYIPMHDLFGNIIALIKPDGDLVESYRFSSFGEEKVPTKPLVSWRYQSKRKIGHLVNFGRRFYDAETGRWLSFDPKGFDEGPNLYQYLLNSPHLSYDLYGEMIEKGVDELGSRLIHKTNLEEGMGPPYTHNVEFTPEIGMQKMEDTPREKSKLGIGGTVGIRANEESMENFLRLISDIAGGARVEGTFPPSKGFFNDLRRGNISMQLVPTETSYLILDRWTKFFDNNTPDARYLEIPYSRGAIDVELALIMAPKEIRERVIVLAIAPAKYIASSFCGGATNYITSKDVVPKLQHVFSRARSPHPEVVNLDSDDPIPGGAHSYDDQIYSKPLEDHIRMFMGYIDD